MPSWDKRERAQCVQRGDDFSDAPDVWKGVLYGVMAVNPMNAVGRHHPGSPGLGRETFSVPQAALVQVRQRIGSSATTH